MANSDGARLLPPPVPLRSGPELFRGAPAGRRLTAPLGGDLGGEVTLRPVSPFDAAAVRAFVLGLSERTRYRRFHTPLPRLTAAQLAGLIDVDHVRSETLLAHVAGRRRSRLVGMAQQVGVRGGVVDIAAVVADDWQGHGIGRLLLRSAASAARDAGATRALVLVQRDNAVALRLARGLATVVAEHAEGPVVELELALVPVGRDRPPAGQGDPAPAAPGRAGGRRAGVREQPRRRGGESADAAPAPAVLSRLPVGHGA